MDNVSGLYKKIAGNMTNNSLVFTAETFLRDSDLLEEPLQEPGSKLSSGDIILFPKISHCWGTFQKYNNFGSSDRSSSLSVLF